MNLRAALERQHSKELTEKIVAYIGGRSERFAEIVDLVIGDHFVLAQRASWVVSVCAEEQPEMAAAEMGRLLQRLRQDAEVHDAVKRHVMRAATFVPLQEDWIGQLADAAFHYLADPKEPVAIRVMAMVSLLRICEQEPSLAAELRLLIEDQLPHIRSAGFHSRAHKVLRALERLETV